MRSKGWVWFLSGKLRPWDLMSLGFTARQLGLEGTRLTVISESGFFPGSLVEVVSWNGQDALARGLTLLFRGNAWHLWGCAPRWWPVISTRALTVHSFKDPEQRWCGHPSVFSGIAAEADPNSWRPAFERDLSWGQPGDSHGDPMALVVFPSSMSRPDRRAIEVLQRGVGLPIAKLTDQGGAFTGASGAIDDGDAVRFLSGRGRLLILPGVDLSSAILAGFAALYGVPTVAPWSPILDDLLGIDGYIALRKDVPIPSGEELIDERGKTAAVAARHRIILNFTPEASALSITNMYKALSEGAL
ncbi:MAG: hypothetical protein U9Q00_01905 [Synergistota bacterium]|nr:hypothetical protein [Synergistota bacterium]